MNPEFRISAMGDLYGTRVPVEGETIEVQHFGACPVLALYHNDRGNYIRLQVEHLETKKLSECVFPFRLDKRT